ncbi:MAG: hypothetical protein CL912_22120 [Deltaproteobacteria bacterium]|nr:hypothetical protein [Deltaproteobacteria bacterium]|tara:strand:+ start:118 stop:297 length:180 start_codon:yes stop_codon:yes gene_type:complete
MERTLKLYTDPISPYSGVATLALLEKKVPYEPIHVSLKTHETKVFQTEARKRCEGHALK